MVDKLLTKGSLTLKRPGRGPETFGRGGGKHLTVRFNDRKVPFDVIKTRHSGSAKPIWTGGW